MNAVLLKRSLGIAHASREPYGKKHVLQSLELHLLVQTEVWLMQITTIGRLSMATNFVQIYLFGNVLVSRSMLSMWEDVGERGGGHGQCSWSCWLSGVWYMVDGYSLADTDG